MASDVREIYIHDSDEDSIEILETNIVSEGTEDRITRPQLPGNGTHRHDSNIYMDSSDDCPEEFDGRNTQGDAGNTHGVQEDEDEEDDLVVMATNRINNMPTLGRDALIRDILSRNLTLGDVSNLEDDDMDSDMDPSFMDEDAMDFIDDAGDYSDLSESYDDPLTMGELMTGNEMRFLEALIMTSTGDLRSVDRAADEFGDWGSSSGSVSPIYSQDPTRGSTRTTSEGGRHVQGQIQEQEHEHEHEQPDQTGEGITEVRSVPADSRRRHSSTAPASETATAPDSNIADNGDDEIHVISMQTRRGEQLPFVITETRVRSPDSRNLHHHHHHLLHHHLHQRQRGRQLPGERDLNSSVLRHIMQFGRTYDGSMEDPAARSELMEAIRRSLADEPPSYRVTEKDIVKKKPIPTTVRKGYTRSLSKDQQCPVCCICETELGRGCAASDMSPVDQALSARMFFLPCGHTYCGSCVADYRSRKRLSKDDKFCAAKDCTQTIKGAKKGDSFRELFGA